MVPKVMGEPMAGGSRKPRLQTAHRGSKPSPLSPAPAGKELRAGGHPGKGGAALSRAGFPNHGWEGDPGTLGAFPRSCHSCSLSGFCRAWTRPAWSGRGEEPAPAGLGEEICCRAASSPPRRCSSAQPVCTSPAISHISCLPSASTSVLLWLPRACEV